MRPSEYLKNTCLTEWEAATNHAFCIELADGTLPLDKMRVYLAQDYSFIDNFIRLASAAIHHAPTLIDRLPLAAFLGVIAGPENTYFQRSFDELNVALSEQESPTLLASTRDFQALMLKASQSGDYANMVAVLSVAEWVYLSWANNVKERVKVSVKGNTEGALPFYFQEWINLHEGAYFESVVGHLRGQLDTAYTSGTDADKEIIKDYFQQAVLLEKQFFDVCYNA